MKTIITVAGLSNSGKSSAIRLLYGKITEKFPDFQFCKDFPPMLPKAIGDFQVVIVINGKLIGIESQGDPSSRIFQTLPFFVKLGCDIIICATRTRGATFDLIESYSDSYGIIRIEKKRVVTALEQHDQDDEVVNKMLKHVSALVKSD